MIDLTDIKTLYVQQSDYSETELGRLEAIASRLELAGAKYEVKSVKSHWKIPELSNIDPLNWVNVKRQNLVIGKISNLTMTESFRSTDFIPPSHANGCFSSCQYCYTARRKGNSNPVTIFINTEDVINSIINHSDSMGPKPPNQCDAKYWTYDIGNNNDVSLDLMLSDIPIEIIEGIKSSQRAKVSFATKTVNIDPLLALDPEDRVRVRYSLMPQSIARYVDIRTSPIIDRIKAINSLVDAGYEVHLNFSPIIIYKGMKEDWIELFSLLDSNLSTEAKEQLACEIIFLTHSKDLHDLNMHWNPKGESFLWSEDLQQTKFNKPDVICYKYDLKKAYVEQFSKLVNKYLPYCTIRYAF
jgi:spore photoproduct lyase